MFITQPNLIVVEIVLQVAYLFFLLFQELKDCCGRVLVDSLPEFSPPQTKIVDFSNIDVILISNYQCMLALPFITEGTGFKGVVYCTEPTLQIGR